MEYEPILPQIMGEIGIIKFTILFILLILALTFLIPAIIIVIFPWLNPYTVVTITNGIRNGILLLAIIDFAMITWRKIQGE